MSDTTELSFIQVLNLLAKHVDKMVQNVSEISVNDVNLLCRALKQVGDVSDKLTSTLKIIDATYDNLSNSVIPDAFEHVGFDSVKFGGFNYILANKLRANISADRQVAGFAWLKEHGLDALIHETVNSNSLSSAIKALIEEKAITPPEEAIKVHTQRYIQVRKS